MKVLQYLVTLCFVSVRGDDAVYIEDEPLRPALEIMNLTDATFDFQTQAMAGMTTGDWLVSFCCCDDCVDLSGLALELGQIENNYVNLAVVDAEEELKLALRFDAVTQSRLILFSKSRMHLYQSENRSTEAMRSFLDAERIPDDGMRIPRRAGPFKPIHDWLTEFFEKVDYRVLCSALGALSVILVLIGALTPHDDEDNSDGTDKDEDDEKKNATSPTKSTTSNSNKQSKKDQ